MTTEDIGILRAAVLWARNHIQVGVEPGMKCAIVQRLDDVLASYTPTSGDMSTLLKRYPAPIKVSCRSGSATGRRHTRPATPSSLGGSGTPG